jgi:two-component system, NtrC family, sensor kinase
MFHFWTHMRSLPLRLVAIVITPLVVLTAVAGVLVLRSLERQFERKMQKDVEIVARALQRPVSHSLERGQHRTLRKNLESALDIGQVYSAYLFDDSGVQLASIGRTDHRTRPPRALSDDLADAPTGRGGYGRVGGEDVYSYYVPVRLGGDRGPGILQITRRKEDFRRFMDRLRLQTLGLLALAALVMVGVVLLGYYGAVGRALGRFSDAIRRVRAGDPDHRAAREGPREVVGLVEAFNSMLDTTQEAERRIAQEREQHSALERRVMASEKLAAIGRLAGGIAHELGSPLGAVAGRIQRIQRNPDLPSSARSEIGAVADDVSRMDRLVRDVLDFARTDRSRHRRMTAATVARMAAARVADEAAAAGTALILPEDDEGPAALADPARLELALVNLLRNAVQAAPGGRVGVRWEQHKERVRWVVTDDGPGLDDEAAERLFEPFFTTRPPGEGTGLGLAIVAAIAAEHGGTVRAERITPRGVRFILEVPQEGRGDTTEGRASDAA